MHRNTPNRRSRDLIALLEKMNVTPVEHLPVDEAREAMREGRNVFGAPPLPGVTTRDRIEEVAPGLNLPLRIYRPEGLEGPLPLIIFYHGGGWVICDLDTHDNAARALSLSAGAVLVSVDYRMAPEHKFPTAVDDCEAATRWAVANAATLGADPARLAVAGDSAGGNLAAIMTHRFKNDQAVRIGYQLLIYPACDMTFSAGSVDTYATGYILTKEAMHWFRDLYLNDPAEALHPDASPLMNDDFTGLPPATIAQAGCDPIRDDGFAYAAKLRAAGTEVRLLDFDDHLHGFINNGGWHHDAIPALMLMGNHIREGLRPRD